jgi:colanic acid/amylovoran biosynthesis glycosyltransferase
VPQSELATIGYVVKRYPRYSETFIVTEILAHEEAGIPVEVFALRPPCDTHFQHEIARVRAPVTYLTSEGIRTADFWSTLVKAAGRLPALWSVLATVEHEDVRDVWQAAELAQHVLDRGIHHLHAHFATAPAAVARLAARMAGITYSFTAHAKDIYGPEVRPEDLRQKLQDASAVITVSDYNLEYLRRTWGSAAVNARRIYNGLALDEFSYASPAARRPHIVAVGRLVEKKGFADLIDACALLAQAARDFTCEIIGAGPLEAPLRERIASTGLSARVQLAGPRPRTDVVRRMQAAAVFAAPCVVSADGDRDGLPTVLLEAMALGAPVATTDVTGIPELVTHDATGLLVRQRDPAHLASVLDLLLANADLRVRLATTARALIDDRFDVRRNAAEIRGLFGQPLGRAADLLEEAV